MSRAKLLLLYCLFRKEVSTLICSFEEADSRMIYILHHILVADTGELIVIRRSDSYNHSALVSCCELYKYLDCLDGYWPKQQQHQKIH